MNIEIYNKNFELLRIIDTYQSLLWNVRYSEHGDFELILGNDKEEMKDVAIDNYISIPTSDRMMIIESIKLEGNYTEGLRNIISGRSLESILTRRIVWNQTTISGKVYEGIFKLIDEAMINPVEEKRKISNFKTKVPTDTAITELTLTESQYTGDNLYDVICNICDKFNIGFKVTLDDNNDFIFELITGVDRSSDQTEYKNPILEFSDDMCNIVSNNYLVDYKNLKNVALVAGEGEGADRRTVPYGYFEGMDRRELYVDARDISSTVQDETTGENVTLTDDSYISLLFERGKEKLTEYIGTKEFDVQVNSDSKQYVVGKDFFVGDYVDVIDHYGSLFKAKITELTYTYTVSEETVHPIFNIQKVINEGLSLDHLTIKTPVGTALTDRISTITIDGKFPVIDDPTSPYYHKFRLKISDITLAANKTYKVSSTLESTSSGEEGLIEEIIDRTGRYSEIIVYYNGSPINIKTGPSGGKFYDTIDSSQYVRDVEVYYEIYPGNLYYSGELIASETGQYYIGPYNNVIIKPVIKATSSGSTNLIDLKNFVDMVYY